MCFIPELSGQNQPSFGARFTPGIVRQASISYRICTISSCFISVNWAVKNSHINPLLLHSQLHDILRSFSDVNLFVIFLSRSSNALGIIPSPPPSPNRREQSTELLREAGDEVRPSGHRQINSLHKERLTISPSASSHTPSIMDDLEDLLQCPICNGRLSLPMTLRCGHSICTKHLIIPAPEEASMVHSNPTFIRGTLVRSLPACPLGECAATAPSRSSTDSLPGSSPSVSFVPDAPTVSSLTTSSALVDVSINRLLSLLDAQGREEGETVSEPESSRDAVAIRAKLQSDLTCEICFSLLHQPITTPCQHVGCVFHIL